MADRLAEAGDRTALGAEAAHRELGDLEIEVHAALDDHPGLGDAAGFQCIPPGGGDPLSAFDKGLALAG